MAEATFRKSTFREYFESLVVAVILALFVRTFGFQAFIKQYLIQYFNDNFFARPKDDVMAEYKRVLKHTLGVDDPDASHIAELHELGYLPIKIKAVKEGTLVPIKVPMLTIENTKPEFFWLTNYLETLMSCQLWMPATSAGVTEITRPRAAALPAAP